MNCLTCHAPVPQDGRFCPACGTAVPESARSEPADPLRDALGVALGTQYEVMQLLGRGGMGAVYLAREKALEREVAIKVLPDDRGATPDMRDRFRREARTAAKLSHPNIVPLHTFGDVNGTLFYVMGFVRGESLAAKLRRAGRLGVEETRRILLELTDALDYAHRLGIVHRDIKPDNVLIDAETGRAMLTDFGIAKALGAGETMTAEGSLLGTPHYMSPEQAQGKADVDRRSDLYSLGVLGYAMLAGRLPFEGKTTGDVLVQHITQAPPPLQALARETPPEMAIAIGRCLEKAPDARWSDARSFAAALAPPSDDDVPPALEGLQGLALAAVAFLLLLAYLGVWIIAGGAVETAFRLLWLLISTTMVATFSAVLIEKVLVARKRGFTPERIRFEILRQPRWWTAVYPRRYRLKGDVWDRLPPELRHARNGMTLWILTAAIFLIPSFLLREGYESRITHVGVPPYPEWLLNTVIFGIIGVSVLLFVFTLVTAARWERRGRALGLSDPQLRAHMMGVPAAKRSFWSKPEIEAVLLPASSSSSTAPSTPDEMVEAVRSIARRLDAVHREIGERAAAAARGLAKSVDRLDEEIRTLAAAVQPGEAARLEEKLAGIRRVASGEGRRDVEALLQKQLELATNLESRLEELKARRARRVELLRTLWMQVVQLSAASGTLQNETSGRILALCSEIATQVESTSTVPATLADAVTEHRAP